MNHLEGVLGEGAGAGVPHGWSENNESDEVIWKAILAAPPLGLKLRKTQSLINLIEKTLAEENAGNELPNKNDTSEDQIIVANDSLRPQRTYSKLKASSFFITKLKIGNWEMIAKNEPDIVGKFYFAKKRMLWEILVDGLKKKIETQWSQILSIRASFNPNQPCIFEVELKTPPQLYKEHDPRPRRHTIWEVTNDFTEGQSPTYRRHYIQLPERTLEKHYEKLLNHDIQMLNLSKNPFPTLSSPYFEPFNNNPNIIPLLQNNESFINYSPPQPLHNIHHSGEFGSSNPYHGQDFYPQNIVVNYPTTEFSAFDQALCYQGADQSTSSDLGINMPQIIQEASVQVHDECPIDLEDIEFVISCFCDDQHVPPDTDSSNVLEPVKDDESLHAIVAQRLSNSSRK